MRGTLKIAIPLAVAMTTAVPAEYMAHWANVRDDSYSIIGQLSEGDYVEVYGTCAEEPSRTWVSGNGLYGTVSTVYIYGGTQEEYLDPWSYGSGYSEGQNSNTSYDSYSDYSYSESQEDNYSITIDTENQVLYVYNNGNLVLSTPVTTGKDSTPTPKGYFNVLAKQTDQTLIGADYEADVSYWMPIYGGVGIHDASWRSYFGGSDYHTYGSHGCINVEPGAMSTIYSLVQEGASVEVK